MSRTHHASRDARRTNRAERRALLELAERAWISAGGPRAVETYAARQRIAATFEVGPDGKLQRRAQ